MHLDSVLKTLIVLFVYSCLTVSKIVPKNLRKETDSLLTWSDDKIMRFNFWKLFQVSRDGGTVPLRVRQALTLSTSPWSDSSNDSFSEFATTDKNADTRLIMRWSLKEISEILYNHHYLKSRLDSTICNCMNTSTAGWMRWKWGEGGIVRSLRWKCSTTSWELNQTTRVADVLHCAVVKCCVSKALSVNLC